MLYDHRCSHCGAERDNVFNTVAERNSNAPVCCGERMPIVIKVAPYGYVEREIHYVCPVTNEGVTTRKQRQYIMESQDLIDANDVASTSAQRKAAKAKKQAEIKAIKDAVPADLQRQFKVMEKTEKQKFMNSL